MEMNFVFTKRHQKIVGTMIAEIPNLLNSITLDIVLVLFDWFSIIWNVLLAKRVFALAVVDTKF